MRNCNGNGALHESSCNRRGEGGAVTPEERDRLARLEATVAGQQKWLEDIDKKLDDLLAAANMGKGAWWVMLRIGGVLVVIGGAAAWLIDKVWK